MMPLELVVLLVLIVPLVVLVVMVVHHFSADSTSRTDGDPHRHPHVRQ